MADIHAEGSTVNGIQGFPSHFQTDRKHGLNEVSSAEAFWSTTIPGQLKITPTIH